MQAATKAGNATAEEHPSPGLLSAFSDWIAGFRPLLGAVSDLAASEARLAAVGLGVMLAAAIALVTMATAVWIGATAALAFWLFDASPLWLNTAGLITALSLAGAVAAYLVMRHFSVYLGFPLTREMLLDSQAHSAGDASDGADDAMGKVAS